jgi:hypothetical protein
MQRGSACDFGPPSVLATGEDWPFAKLKLEHQEEKVRNRYRRSYICIAFVLLSALSLLAQSDHIDVQRWDDLQLKVGDASQPLLAATLAEAPVLGGVSSESELPDAPSTTKSDASTADPAASPAIKRESFQGAPPAAMGGPLGADRSVADRNYLLLTGGMFGASIANAELTIRCLKQGTCAYVPSSYRSRTALYGIGIPADLGISYLTYYMKKKHSRIWYVPAALVTVANVYVGVHAYRRTQE